MCSLFFKWESWLNGGLYWHVTFIIWLLNSFNIFLYLSRSVCLALCFTPPHISKQKKTLKRYTDASSRLSFLSVLPQVWLRLTLFLNFEIYLFMYMCLCWFNLHYVTLLCLPSFFCSVSFIFTHPALSSPPSNSCSVLFTWPTLCIEATVFTSVFVVVCMNMVAFSLHPVLFSWSNVWVSISSFFLFSTVSLFWFYMFGLYFIKSFCTCSACCLCLGHVYPCLFWLSCTRTHECCLCTEWSYVEYSFFFEVIFTSMIY